jgi:acyl carrier protein
MKSDDQTNTPSGGELRNGGQGLGQSTASVGSPPPRTVAEIQDWFVETLSRLTHAPPEEIDVTVPFENFALDSVAAVGLTGELEEWLGKNVDPMAVYDYPTIEALAKHLAEHSTAGAHES